MPERGRELHALQDATAPTVVAGAGATAVHAVHLDAQVLTTALPQRRSFRSSHLAACCVGAAAQVAWDARLLLWESRSFSRLCQRPPLARQRDVVVRGDLAAYHRDVSIGPWRRLDGPP